MLKACWDCLAGERQVNEQYGMVTNGDLHSNWERSPPTSKMHLSIPRPLQNGDEVLVELTTEDSPSMLTVNIVPSNSSDIVFGMRIDTEIKFEIREGGNTTDVTKEALNAQDYLAGDVSLYRFKIVNNNQLDVQLNESDMATVPLLHSLDAMQHITFDGQIVKINKFTVNFA